jgi:hypothetical protein
MKKNPSHAYKTKHRLITPRETMGYLHIHWRSDEEDYKTL